MKKTYTFLAMLLSVVMLNAQSKKPNILVIWGDDIGRANISAYTMGMMGYQTPNIDRIANEGMMFTDYYAEQSCTAGRSSFIMGQSVFRTGLSKVGLPGANEGMQVEDPTIAGLLKNQDYATGQFGKNHLGDKDEMLPTNHGFDEFFGNLYHLNAEEEPENEDYPKDPEFHKNFGPRGVLKTSADGTIEDTGPLTRKRMETADTEFLNASLDFIERAHAADKPFFVWHNSTRMHVWTRLKAESEGKTGLGIGLLEEAALDHIPVIAIDPKGDMGNLLLTSIFETDQPVIVELDPTATGLVMTGRKRLLPRSGWWELDLGDDGFVWASSAYLAAFGGTRDDTAWLDGTPLTEPKILDFD